MQPRRDWTQEIFNAEKRALVLPFLLEQAYDLLVLRGSMRGQRSALLHRVRPPSLRPHQYPTESNLRYPNKLQWFVQWFVTWLGASVLSLLVLGLLLAMHC